MFGKNITGLYLLTLKYITSAATGRAVTLTILRFSRLRNIQFTETGSDISVGILRRLFIGKSIAALVLRLGKSLV